MAPSRGTADKGYVDGIRYKCAGAKHFHIFVPSAESTGRVQRYTIRTIDVHGTPFGHVEDLVRAKVLSLRTAAAAPAAKPVAADAPVADSDSDAGQRQSKRSRKGERDAPFSPSKGWTPYERTRVDDGRHASTRDCFYEELSVFVASVRPHFAALLRRSPEDVEGAIEALQIAFAERIDDEEAVAESAAIEPRLPVPPRAVGEGGASAGGERTAAGGAAAGGAAASGAPQREAAGGEMTAAGGEMTAAGGTAAGGAVARGSSVGDAARNASDGAARPGAELPPVTAPVVAGQELRRTLKEIIMLQNSRKIAEARGLAARSQAKRSELGPDQDAKLAKREAELAKKRAQKMRTDFFSLGPAGLEEHGKGWVQLQYSPHQDRVDLRLNGEWWHSDEGSTEDNQNKKPIRVYPSGDRRNRLGAARRAAARVSAPVSAPVTEGSGGAGCAGGEAAGGAAAGGVVAGGDSARGEEETRSYCIHWRRAQNGSNKDVLTAFRESPQARMLAEATKTAKRPGGVAVFIKLLVKARCRCIKPRQSAECDCKICSAVHHNLPIFNKSRQVWRQRAELAGECACGTCSQPAVKAAHGTQVLLPCPAD